MKTQQELNMPPKRKKKKKRKQKQKKERIFIAINDETE